VQILVAMPRVPPNPSSVQAAHTFIAAFIAESKCDDQIIPKNGSFKMYVFMFDVYSGFARATGQIQAGCRDLHAKLINVLELCVWLCRCVFTVPRFQSNVSTARRRARRGRSFARRVESSTKQDGGDTIL